jgi:hypothetical protein
MLSSERGAMGAAVAALTMLGARRAGGIGSADVAWAGREVSMNGVPTCFLHCENPFLTLA